MLIAISLSQQTFSSNLQAGDSGTKPNKLGKEQAWGCLKDTEALEYTYTLQ